MTSRRKRAAALVVCFFTAMGLGFGGCAPVRLKTRSGVYHRVRSGETLWRICYTYQANMKTVCRFNRIRDPERISVGQEIFIPGADRVRRVDPAPVRTGPEDTAGA